MADPIELQIVEAIRTRLAAIDGSGDFHTDAGERVFLERFLDPDNDTFPAIVVWTGEAVLGGDHTARGKLLWQLPIVVEGLVTVADADPLADTLKLARDIKAALYRSTQERLVAETQPVTFEKVEHFPAEPGSRLAATQVSLSVGFVESFTG